MLAWLPVGHSNRDHCPWRALARQGVLDARRGGFHQTAQAELEFFHPPLHLPGDLAVAEMGPSRRSADQRWSEIAHDDNCARLRSANQGSPHPVGAHQGVDFFPALSHVAKSNRLHIHHSHGSEGDHISAKRITNVTRIGRMALFFCRRAGRRREGSIGGLRWVLEGGEKDIVYRFLNISSFTTIDPAPVAETVTELILPA